MPLLEVAANQTCYLRCRNYFSLLLIHSLLRRLTRFHFLVFSLIEDPEHMKVGLLQPKLFGYLVQMKVDFALLISDPVETGTEVKAVTLAYLEQKLDFVVGLLGESGLLLLLKLLPQL